VAQVAREVPMEHQGPAEQATGCGGFSCSEYYVCKNPQLLEDAVTREAAATLVLGHRFHCEMVDLDAEERCSSTSLQPMER
jgi:hypothetical protein